MLKAMWALILIFFWCNLLHAQSGFLRVIVRDEQGSPTPAVVRFHPQVYDFCRPWSALTLSNWHSHFLALAQDLGREPTLHEWVQRMVQWGIIPEETYLLTDERGEVVLSLRPGIYSVYAWAPGYGVACAHYVFVRPDETTEVKLTLPRIPITVLEVRWDDFQPVNYFSLRLAQNGWVSPINYLLTFKPIVRFPLAEYHPRSPRDFCLGDFLAIFEADRKQAKKSFRIERWGEIIDLGTLDFKTETEKEGLKVPVTFRVFWSDGKTPATGVSVYWVNVKTDEEGRVQIDMPLGGNEVKVQVPPELWEKGISSYHWVYITPATKEVKIVLPQPGKVQGFVRYENETPVVNAKVEMEMLIHDGFRTLSEPNLRGRTDEQGAFLFPFVPPGKFVLRVWDGRLFAERFLEIKSGQILQVNITLSLPASRYLVGEIKLPSGEPAAGTPIIIGLSDFFFADAQGRFEKQHWTTEEPFFAFLPGKGSAFSWLEILPSKDPMQISLTLENTTIKGRLVDEQGQPIPMAVVRLGKPGFYFTGLLAAHTDANGEFAITQVPSGKWRLIVEELTVPYSSRLPVPALLKSVSIPANEVVDLGTLKVSTKVGHISGRVIFPKDFGRREGEQFVNIYLQPENWQKQKISEVLPLRPEFYCRSLPPGTYWVWAQGIGWTSEPQKVVIPENGSSVPVTLTLKRAGILKVFVKDAKTGRPISAGVTVTDKNGLELAFRYADSEGEVCFENLPHGTYKLAVWKPLYRRASLILEVSSEETRTVKVELEPKG